MIDHGTYPESETDSWRNATERANACARRAEQLLRDGKVGTATVMMLLALDARLQCVEFAVGDLPK